jgi:MoaD family protein
MAKVTVKFYSLWQVYAGTESAGLEADSLAEALAEIEQRFGGKIREGMKAKGIVLDGKIEQFSLVLLNGTNIKQLQDARLKDGDTIHIMPPLAGG